MNHALVLTFIILAQREPEVLPTQDPPLLRIEGIVIDSRTREPLPNVNIFLSNTTRGTSTSTNGEFVLRDIPAGIYELVSSMVGYERKTIRLRLLGATTEHLRIDMTEVAIETPPVDVVGKEPREWKSQLETFLRYIFGKTDNGSQCTILNPEILDFTVTPASGEFSATARGPLRIENSTLGYRLEFMLKVFEINGNALRYGGDVLFIRMKATDADKEREWEENRQRTYRGSLRHFLVAVAQNRLKEEGFRVYKVAQLPGGWRARVPKQPVSASEILRQGEFDFERRLSFDQYLMIEYLPELPEREFADFWTHQVGLQGSALMGYQTSWLKLDVSEVFMTTNGNLYDPFSVRTYGYWSFERLGEWLPLEYRPAR